MPLPLPNLDDRLFTDLVAEARALIPRYAPEWTDHNLHDPGITVMELLAWLLEQDIYRLNRIPERHRRKFLALLGFNPEPPRAAQTVLSFTLKPAAGQVLLPAGTLVTTPDSRGQALPFCTREVLTVVPAALSAIQVDDGQTLQDYTRVWGEGQGLPALGPDASSPARTYTVAAGDTVLSVAQRFEASPEALVAANRLSGPDAQLSTGQQLTLPVSPALYLGFKQDQPLPPGVPVSIWLRFQGPGTGFQERDLLVQEHNRQLQAGKSFWPQVTCPPQAGTAQPGCEVIEPSSSPGPSPTTAQPDLLHHSARVTWEFFAAEAGGRWRALDPAAGEVLDDTRSLTLDGPVHLQLPAAMQGRGLGKIPEALFYLRVRLESGQFDAAPVLLDATLNSVALDQIEPVWQKFQIAAGVDPAGPIPPAGTKSRLRLTFNADREIVSLAFEPGSPDLPEVSVLSYVAPTAEQPGELTLGLLVVGISDGQPLQGFFLPLSPVLEESLSLWTLVNAAWQPWTVRPDLDAASRLAFHYTVDASTGRVSFGDGERGRIPPQGALILASYQATRGNGGNIPAHLIWQVADNLYNRGLLPDFAAVQNALDGIDNHAPASGGADAESFEPAAGRASEVLWAHERLVELCYQDGCASLDQLDPSDIAARRTPERAATLLDFERLALNVPGTRIARARAWAGIDPNYPCLKAPGTVMLVIVPELPRGRPQASPGLLKAVKRYLDYRRVIGTRLVVVGPHYLQVTISTQVQSKAGANLDQVRAGVIQGLNAFLDPLQGGPLGRGWPFGRDVYISEIMKVIDDVPGVDHVLSLELIPDQGVPQCGNLCVGPTWLVTPGAHVVEVT
jgi:LysM repeat protein